MQTYITIYLPWTGALAVYVIDDQRVTHHTVKGGDQDVTRADVAWVVRALRDTTGRHGDYQSVISRYRY